MTRKIKLASNQIKTKKEGRGGKREGAGRKKGTPNKRTLYLKELSEKAVDSGITPLEVMLNNMRSYYNDLDGLLSRLVDEKGKPVSIGDARLILGLRQLAGNAAKDAAPFCHPKLQSITHSGKIGGPSEEITKDMDPKKAAEIYAAMLKE